MPPKDREIENCTYKGKDRRTDPEGKQIRLRLSMKDYWNIGKTVIGGIITFAVAVALLQWQVKVLADNDKEKNKKIEAVQEENRKQGNDIVRIETKLDDIAKEQTLVRKDVRQLLLYLVPREVRMEDDG